MSQNNGDQAAANKENLQVANSSKNNCNGSQVPEMYSDRKKQTTILNMIEHDCTQMYDRYGRNKDFLKYAIECYEEFIHAEINSLFEQSNSFSQIIFTHRNHFKEFIDHIYTFDMMPTNAKQRRMEDMYIIYTTVQEWLLQGPKGHHFYTMVDIDAFKFYKNWNSAPTQIITQTVLTTYGLLASLN